MEREMGEWGIRWDWGWGWMGWGNWRWNVRGVRDWVGLREMDLDQMNEVVVINCSNRI